MSMIDATSEEKEALSILLSNLSGIVRNSKKLVVRQLILETPVERDLDKEQESNTEWAIFKHTGERVVHLDFTVIEQ